MWLYTLVPLQYNPLRNHVPQVDIYSHISHLPFCSHNLQASFCHLYNNTTQIIMNSLIPQTTRSAPPVSEKVRFGKLLVQPHFPSLLIPYFRVILWSHYPGFPCSQVRCIYKALSRSSLQPGPSIYLLSMFTNSQIHI